MDLEIWFGNNSISKMRKICKYVRRMPCLKTLRVGWIGAPSRNAEGISVSQKSATLEELELLTFYLPIKTFRCPSSKSMELHVSPKNFPLMICPQTLVELHFNILYSEDDYRFDEQMQIDEQIVKQIVEAFSRTINQLHLLKKLSLTELDDFGVSHCTLDVNSSSLEVLELEGPLKILSAE